MTEIIIYKEGSKANIQLKNIKKTKFSEEKLHPG